MKILVAEDEMIMCSDGREAIVKIAATNPDLIITDIMMPFASGLEIIEAVKKNDGKQAKIIVLSAMGQENVVLEAFQLGADDFITKPFSLNELSMRVKRYTPLTF